MIEKIANWWLTGIVILLYSAITAGILIVSIILTCIYNNALWLLLNIIYLFITPFYMLGWETLIKIVKDGGVL